MKTQNQSASTAQHTAGPWEVSDGAVLSKGLNQYGNWIIASCQRERTEEDEANLRLIAAAPELLAACQGLFALIESGTLVRDTSRDADPKWYLTAMELTRALQAAAAAIANAQGGAK